MIEQYSPAWCMLHPFQASILACSVEEELGTQLKLLIQREELETQIKQLENRLDGWQPIETAPKDGRVILIFNALQGWPRHDMLVMGYWWDGVLPEDYEPDEYFTRINKGPGWWAMSWGYIAFPTHWMSLLKPPESFAEEHDAQR